MLVGFSPPLFSPVLVLSSLSLTWKAEEQKQPSEPSAAGASRGEARAEILPFPHSAANFGGRGEMATGLFLGISS